MFLQDFSSRPGGPKIRESGKQMLAAELMAQADEIQIGHHITYHIVPVAATKSGLTWAHVIEAKPTIELLNIIVRKQCEPVCYLRVLDSLDIRSQQDAANTHRLILWPNSY